MRLFIDANGHSYKADKAKDPSDMERMNPSPEQLDALPEDGSPLSMFDHAEAIRLIDAVIDPIITAQEEII